jgi:DNA-binding transcriptional ArsR family regulator
MADSNQRVIKVNRLSSDTDFYNNVFKKTEKIISVIFYVISETNKDERTESHISVLKDRGLSTHEASLKTLQLQTHEIDTGLLEFQYRLVALESTLRVAETARVVPTDIVRIITEQIDGVLRYINNHYLNQRGVSLEELTEVLVPKEKPASAKKSTPPSESSASSPNRQRRVNIPAGDISSDAYLVYSQLTDRAERIKTVLEAKPQATVKDIAEVITDVSEKTIQRELNSLIEKGQVEREGERRWSRYSVVK